MAESEEPRGSDVSEDLSQFIQLAIPTYEAAEVLLFLAAHVTREWTPAEIAMAMRRVEIAVTAVESYVGP